EGGWRADGRDREYWRVEARGGAVWDLYFDRQHDRWHMERLWDYAARSNVFATFLRSATNARIASSRASSGVRRIDDGCTVAITNGASGDSTNRPRSCVTRNDRPRSACAAVAPRHTTTVGRTCSSSASSHGRHASCSRRPGLRWIRRLPRGAGFHRKCLTTLVTKTSARSIPASSKARSRT